MEEKQNLMQDVTPELEKKIIEEWKEKIIKQEQALFDEIPDSVKQKVIDRYLQNLREIEKKTQSVTRKESLNVIKKHMLYAAGAGLIIVPVLDIAAVAAIQYKMIGDIKAVYKAQGIEIPHEFGRPIVASLLGAGGASLLSSSQVGAVTAGGLSMVSPIVGAAVNMLSMPLFSAALTYAVGIYFVDFFEDREELENFNREKALEKIISKLSEGKKFASGLLA